MKMQYTTKVQVPQSGTYFPPLPAVYSKTKTLNIRINECDLEPDKQQTVMK